MSHWRSWKTTQAIEKLGFSVEKTKENLFRVWKGNIVAATVNGGQGLFEFLMRVRKKKTNG